MKKSFFLDFLQLKAAPCTLADLQIQKCTSIRHAEVQCWKSPLLEAIVQEFDGHYGYLYQYEFKTSLRQLIPLRVILSDIHIVYHIEGSQSILLDGGKEHIYFKPERACYLYLPQGDYNIRLAKGYSKVIGFYFDSGIFRNNNERPFPFLKDILYAHRNAGISVISSSDFRIGPRTLAHLNYLFDLLKINDLNNESFILQSLIRLIQLSKEKVFEEYELLNNPLILAQRVEALMKNYVEWYGQNFSIQQVADDIGISVPYLYQLVKKQYKFSPKELKHKLLLEFIETLFAKNYSISETAHLSNFSSVSSFSHFFKRQLKISPQDYLNKKCK